MRGRCRDFLYTLYPLHIASLPFTSPPDGASVTIDEPTWTCPHHPKSILYLRAHSCVVHSMGLDKCIKTCIHHYSVIQSSFTALKILYAPPIHLFTSPCPGHWFWMCKGPEAENTSSVFSNQQSLAGDLAPHACWPHCPELLSPLHGCSDAPRCQLGWGVSVWELASP